MFKLIKERFDLWCRKRWLKTINKETNRYYKFKSRLSIQMDIVNALVKRYNEIYSCEERKPDTNLSAYQDTNTNANDITLKNIEVK